MGSQIEEVENCYSISADNAFNENTVVSVECELDLAYCVVASEAWEKIKVTTLYVTSFFTTILGESLEQISHFHRQIKITYVFHKENKTLLGP